MRLLAPAAALLAALALAACSGGEPPPAPAATPEATPAAEAPSTPAPTAEATPTPAPAPTPEPPPEAACANGVAVEEPEARPGLVADCVALLASRDALRGEAALDWGGDLAIGRWEGVAVEGEPPRVTGLDLSDRGLTGSIPRTLRRLPLDEVRLAGNALTGCVPSAFGDARGDAAYLGLPWCLRYDRLDATGAVAEAGEWAILDAGGEVLATWEGLRSEAATLRVHQTDAGGTSWAPEFGAVSGGGLFEWRKASDCWVRYHVTGDPVRPTAGSGRWEFPVEWMTYAATGEGCTGAVGASAVLRVDEAPPRLMSHAHTAPSQVVTSPVRHGPFLMYPIGWTGEMATPTQVALPDAPANVGMTLYATDVATARQHPLWRDPDLPSEWILRYMRSPLYGFEGYEAYYVTAEGYGAARISVGRVDWHPINIRTYTSGGTFVHEFRLIDGLPALARYSLTGIRTSEIAIWDRANGLLYGMKGSHSPLRNDIEAAFAVVRGLISSPGAP